MWLKNTLRFGLRTSYLLQSFLLLSLVQLFKSQMLLTPPAAKTSVYVIKPIGHNRFITIIISTSVTI